MIDPHTSEAERYWDPRHPVLEILRRRRSTGSRPGARDDSAKIALTVSGGGMRGAISAAMCTQIDDSGFKDAFDVVYGCSSGAINAAYFVAQTSRTCWYPLSIYYDDLSTKKFIDYRRVLRGNSILDLDYVFDELLDSLKPLNLQAIIDSPVPLVVSVTDVDTQKTITVRDFATAVELKTMLHAGARLPLAVKGMTEVGGRRLLDGALLTPLPFRLAVEDGCTHVLSLSTHRMIDSHRIPRPVRPTSLGHHAYSGYLERIQRGLGTAYLSAVRQRQCDREWLTRQRFATSADGPHVLDLAPLPWMRDIRLYQCDPGAVFEGIRDAYAVAHCATEGVSTGRIRDGLIRAMPKMAMIDSHAAASFTQRRRLPPSEPAPASELSA
ncbi:patatin-like phospholipase family protein [Nocardia colli]|uniref:patatin-like phospholipase family protein n=1 Tax=Nocardia colli TaxID=2545717 RepID=UPI0035DB0080